MKNTSKALLAGTIALFAANLHASAQIVSQVDGGDPTLNVDSVPSTTQGPNGTTGSDGYYFFHDEDRSATNNTGVADRYSLPSYVTSVVGLGGETVSDGPPDGLINIAGVTYTPGREFNFYSDGVPQDLAKINLESALPSSIPLSFDIGFLLDNYSGQNGAADTTKLSLALFDPTVSTTVPVSSTAVNTTNTGNKPASSSSYSDDFYYANVTGAAPGDYLIVYGNTPASTPGIGGLGVGGVTFDTVPITTPEPSTVALMLAGLGALVLVARLRRRNA